MLSSKRGSNRSNRRAGGLFVALLAAALVVHTALGASAPAVAPLSDAEKIDALIRAVEARKDLQFIRLNGAVVGGLVGVALAVGHWLAG